MPSLKELLAKLNQNLNILLERKAKFGEQVPLALLNQIEDYRTAIALTEQTIAGEMSEVELAEALEPLNLDFPSNVTVVHRYTPAEAYVPYQAPSLPPHFVEREEIGRVKVALLTADTPALALTALHGMGGIGKTTLAVALAHEQEVIEHFKDGILWANLGPNSLVENWQVTWGRALGDDLRTYPDPATKATRLRELLAHRCCLLVIDDAWPETDLADLLVGTPACRTLVTTRQGSVAQKIGATTISVDVLSEDEALALLVSWAGNLSSQQALLAAELVKRLGYLPLAVALAGAQIQDGASPSEILALFQTQQGDLSSMDLENPQRREESLRLCFDLSIQRFTKADRSRFAQLGVFAANEPFDLMAAETVWGIKNGAKHIRLLVRHALLNRTENNDYLIHPLLRDYARSLLSEAEWAAAAERHTVHYLQMAQTSEETWQIAESCLGQIRVAWERVKEVEDKRMFEFVDGMDSFFERRGLWHEKMDWTQNGLAAAKKSNNREKEAIYLNNIGYAHRLLGRWDEALVYYRQALNVDTDLSNKAGIGVRLSNIGEIYRLRGDLDKALDHYHQSLELGREMEHKAGIAIRLNNIGRIYHTRGDLEQALNYYHQALEIKQELGNKIGVSATLADIGTIYHDQGDLTQALNYYHQGLDLGRELGNKSYESRVLNNIGYVYQDQGDLVEALTYFYQALEIGQKLGDKSGMADFLWNIGNVYFKQQQFAEAELVLVEAVELFEMLNSLKVVKVREQLVQVRERMEKFTQTKKQTEMGE